ncbi:tetraacyldisaccharide 4'-kinase [Thalassotalea euphylliae]|uniref:Tetraacyldisaccharide 4'-kinase n=1 Tax=Thalassotalea euphylliae TaxID=1655234 RepID=A0A3E0TSU6_9GAMM|nr:tetraacyldisaccharide 4'-kinase [Thalassotalea euphylliae]REL27716.1 tetraacyldisaccharide 4'-kinase [Thalassotalea euphylliae]
MRLIEKVWFYRHPAKWALVPLLLPLTALFWLITSLRRFLYRCGVKSSTSPALPVMVIGNIGIGGNGKTPLTLYLIEQCERLGIKVGIISRGYGGKAPHYPYLINEYSTAAQAGDEPQMIFDRSGVPIAVGSDRIASIALLAEQGCQLVLADDGLQHYKMKRNAEVIVVDGKRKFGNGLLLPAGPLREGKWRLSSVDFIVVNGKSEADTGAAHKPSSSQENNVQNADDFSGLTTPVLAMDLAPSQFINLATGEAIGVDEFIEINSTVNAIAAIGDPARFFTTLEQCKLTLNKAQGFVDHHAFTAQELTELSASMPLVMTEKDAVKCQAFAQENWWYLAVNATFEVTDAELLHQQLKRLVSTC